MRSSIYHRHDIIAAADASLKDIGSLSIAAQAVEDLQMLPPAIKAGEGQNIRLQFVSGIHGGAVDLDRKRREARL